MVFDHWFAGHLPLARDVAVPSDAAGARAVVVDFGVLGVHVEVLVRRCLGFEIADRRRADVVVHVLAVSRSHQRLPAPVDGTRAETRPVLKVRRVSRVATVGWSRQQHVVHQEEEVTERHLLVLLRAVQRVRLLNLKNETSRIQFL